MKSTQQGVPPSVVRRPSGLALALLPALLAIAVLPSVSAGQGIAAASASGDRVVAVATAKPQDAAGGWLPPASELPLSDEFQALVAGLVRENLPEQIEDAREWGQQKRMTTGVRIRRDGWRLETSRRKKEVNHGSWKKYRLELVQPERHFRLKLENVRRAEDGRLAFDLTTRARLAAFGRWSRWQRGVQLISLSAEADAVVELRADCRLALLLDPGRLPPDVVLSAEVVDARLRLIDFRLRRLSDIKGPLAGQIGRAMEEVVEDRLAAKRRGLAGKLNRQLEKHQDKLRLSLADLLDSPWSGAAGEVVRPGRADRKPVAEDATRDTSS